MLPFVLKCLADTDPTNEANVRLVTYTKTNCY